MRRMIRQCGKPYLFAEDVQEQPQTFEAYDKWMYVVVRKGYEHPEIVGKYVSAIFDYSRYEDDRYANDVNKYFAINVDPTARPMNINVDYIDALFRCETNLEAALVGGGDQQGSKPPLGSKNPITIPAEHT